MDRLTARGRSLDLTGRTAVMGIVNVTPDSFYEGSRVTVGAALARAARMVEEGADILDIGGESTRPGHAPVDEAEETARVLPVVEAVVRECGAAALVSVDTTKPGLMRRCLEAGAHIINDVSPDTNPEMLALALEYGAALVLMHARRDTDRPAEDEVFASLARRADEAARAGLPPASVLVDPGIGFGKTAEENLAVLRAMGRVRDIPAVSLMALSRKSVFGALLGLPAQERLEATLAADVLAAAAGYDVVRVHDVEAHRRALATARAVAGKGSLSCRGSMKS